MKVQLIKLTLVAICFILSANNAYSQKWEAGLSLGASNYQGDLAHDIVLSETHPAFGLFFKNNISPYFSAGLFLNHGTISGDDNNFEHLERRNLNFKSNITELSALVEFNFFNFAKGLRPRNFSPYVFTGIGIFRYNPKTYYEGEWVSLRAMGTEGQGVIENESNVNPRYGSVSVSIPVGGGFKYSINDRYNLGFHLGFRYSFSDYIDDVSGTYYDVDEIMKYNGTMAGDLADRSGEGGLDTYAKPGKQRGTPDVNDWYIFTGISISYKIRNPICFKF